MLTFTHSLATLFIISIAVQDLVQGRHDKHHGTHIHIGHGRPFNHCIKLYTPNSTTIHVHKLYIIHYIYLFFAIVVHNVLEDM